MTEVAVIGVGMHPWGKFEKPLMEMCTEAVSRALEDAGLEWEDVQGIAAGSSRFSGGMGWGLAGNELAAALGETGVPIVNVSAACATGGSAFHAAYLMVASGLRDVVLAVAGEKMPKGFIPRAPGAAEDATDVDFIRWKAIGIPNPGYWALECQRRMEDYGTTEVQLAKVAVKAHKNGVHNPYARYRKAFTVEEVLASPMVNYPLRLYEICAVSDGAAAAVLCSAKRAKRHTAKPVMVAASTVATGRYGDPQIRIPNISATALPSAPHTSEATGAVWAAYEQAGMGPRDVGFIELQDNSVWQELAMPELFGLFKPGEAEKMLDRDETEITGKLPINPSGGFQCFGEATTAMGLLQLCELVWQLRGQAGARQIQGAQVGLSQTLGLGGNGAAIILKC